jgi:hypothetical protein
VLNSARHCDAGRLFRSSESQRAHEATVDTHLTSVLRSRERQRSEKPPKKIFGFEFLELKIRLGGFFVYKALGNQGRRSLAVTLESSRICWKHVPDCATGRSQTIVNRGSATPTWNDSVKTSGTDSGERPNGNLLTYGFAKYRRSHPA